MSHVSPLGFVPFCTHGHAYPSCLMQERTFWPQIENERGMILSTVMGTERSSLLGPISPFYKSVYHQNDFEAVILRSSRYKMLL